MQWGGSTTALAAPSIHRQAGSWGPVAPAGLCAHRRTTVSHGTVLVWRPAKPQARQGSGEAILQQLPLGTARQQGGNAAHTIGVSSAGRARSYRISGVSDATAYQAGAAWPRLA
jgi:hypothetical protein